VRCGSRNGQAGFAPNRPCRSGHPSCPLVRPPAYMDLIPVAERTSPEILSLPMFPTLTRSQQEYVAESVLGHVDSPQSTLHSDDAGLLAKM
jgi:dTDP-4-amino-4,6-dideoxygalactose transaminase